MEGMIPGVTTLKTEPTRSRLGRPQFGAHHRRRMARPARQFPGSSRACGRRPTGSARPCSIGCSTPSPAPAAWIFRRAPGARARGPVPGRQAVVFVEQAGRRARALQEQLARLGGTRQGPSRGNGRARFCAPRARCSTGSCVSGPAVREGALAEYVPCWMPATGSSRGAGLPGNEKAAGAPALPAHWELLKSKSAGEVGYHLARVNARGGVN
jgi:hypothetical protein